MLRIGISGSHSVGKTTFAETLASFLRQNGRTATVAGEPIKVVQKQFQSIGSKKSQLQLFQLLMAEHFKRLSETEDADYIIYDRTLLDFTAYLEIEGKFEPTFLKMVKQILPYYMTFIECSFLLRAESPIEDNSLRPMSEEHRDNIEHTIIGYIHELKINHVTLTGSIEQRVTEAWNKLKQP